MGVSSHKYLHSYLANDRDTPVVEDSKMNIEDVGGTYSGMEVLTPQG